MDRFAAHRMGFAAFEEVRGGFGSRFERKESLLCPKPRRRAADFVRPLSVHPSHQVGWTGSGAGEDILDIILTIDGYDGIDQPSDSQLSSSPPYFCGSPPSRAANPLVRDAHFLEEKPNNNPLTPLPFLSPRPSTPTPAGARQGGCFRTTTNFGPQPAMVRIEGFDCLDRDRRGCSIPAVA